MEPPTMNSSDSHSLKRDTLFGIVIFILGLVILVVSGSTPWKEVGWQIGWLLVAIGTPLILWRLFLNLANQNLIGIMALMRKEKLQAIIKDKKRSKKLIADSIVEWAQSQKGGIIRIKGVTLNLIFGNTGILKELVEEDKLINGDKKAIRVLLLNPYSMNAITRSIQESRPFQVNYDPVSDICKHTLKLHKKCVLYEDFECTVDNIKDLMKFHKKHQLRIDCKIYSTASPSFLLLDGKRAISENLILARKKDDPEGKLYGLLPHLVYGNGEIKDSLESHFDYIWDYDSIPLADFHTEVEEKYYEINRLFLLYSLQKEIWEREWSGKQPGRSFDSAYDQLYQGYKEFYPGFSPKKILDLGCGDGGGGSRTFLEEYPGATINFVDIAENAIKLFKQNIEAVNQKYEMEKKPKLDVRNAELEDCDMLTFLNRCEPLQYSLVHANFSIIYMTKIKAVEIYRKIFDTLYRGGIFMLSVWTTKYFNMPIGKHGEEGYRPPHEFTRIPMTEDLQVLIGGSTRIGEIRRFYRGYEELLEEFQSADEKKVMDFENIHFRYYEDGAILRVWVKKK
ncbi:MAG TPA: class I SAM-dependent methyltransferase [Anaerolineae bacterium]|nr:class I SAM-dependent methyltransferase [Anaerolineae bacterium]